MSNVNMEQKLRLVQQIRSRYDENRYDMYNRERILYGRAAPVSRETDGDMEGGELPSGLSSFRLRLLLAVMLFAVVVAMDVNEIDVAGVTTEKILEVISIDYEDKIDEWVAALSQ